MTKHAPEQRDILAGRVRAALASRQNVREQRMFGGVSFMVDESLAVAVARDGGLLVRVPPAKYDDLIRQGGEPAYMGKDRPMGRGWLTVPNHRLQREGELASWITIGIDSRRS